MSSSPSPSSSELSSSPASPLDAPDATATSQTMPTPPPRPRTAGASSTRLENLRAMVDAALRPDNAPRPTNAGATTAPTNSSPLSRTSHVASQWTDAARKVPGLQEAIRNHLILLAADALTRGVPVPGLDDLAGALPILRPHPLPHPRSPVAVLDDLLTLYIARFKSGEIPYPYRPETSQNGADMVDWTLAVDPVGPGRVLFNSRHRGEIIANARGIVLAYGHITTL
ncbi:hypothetical protein FKP32DRAFT_1672153 [Trametes sanguinea]|nr:hypothetical protein FKP32DRAFT_1672153 [Trametes sanguinea]